MTTRLARIRPRSTTPAGWVVTAASVLCLSLAACGGDADTTASTTEEPTPPPTATEQATGHGDMSMGDMADTAGGPADPAAADRTVEVNVDNDLRFEPDSFQAAADEVVTFRISNTGNVEHEFVLGDEEAQQEMAEMMSGSGGHDHSGQMSNAVTIHPGETAELTWRFAAPGTVLIGCHVDGHYEAGMQGEVTVS